MSQQAPATCSVHRTTSGTRSLRPPCLADAGHALFLATVDPHLTTENRALEIQKDLKNALLALFDKELVDRVAPKVEPCRVAVYGDYTTNVAMVLSRQVEKPAMEVAREIIAKMQCPGPGGLKKIEPMGPGFINFYIAGAETIIERILKTGSQFPELETTRERVLVEYVSANPTGPLHVGHGRGAAYGSALADLNKRFGHHVEHEYYVNDAGRQVDVLGLSVWLRYLEGAKARKTIPFPLSAYQGSYIRDRADELRDEYGDKFVPTPSDQPEWTATTNDAEKRIDELIVFQNLAIGEADTARIRKFALAKIKQDIKRDLKDFKVTFRHWQSERELIEQKKIEEVLKILREREHTYRHDGALWFRSTHFGDVKDHVVQRSDGRFTYFASDIAYHKDKFDRRDREGRPYDRFINVWGADHHGYETRLRAALSAMGYEKQKLHTVFVQFVTLLRDGQKEPMSTRAGSFVTLRDLYEEVGVEAARFFFLFRKPSQHLDFDIDLAKSRNEKNPVFYIQYAHARIRSVSAKAKDLYPDTTGKSDQLHLLREKEEVDLINHLHLYSHTLNIAFRAHEPHHVLVYLRDLAAKLHSCYNRHQVLVDDPHLRKARLRLFLATARVLENGLGICGITAPVRM